MMAWDEEMGAGVVDVYLMVARICGGELRGRRGVQDFAICCAISSSVRPQSTIASANPSQRGK